MSAGTSAGALPVNQMEQGKENMTDGQDKSLMENLTCCCMGWQWQEEAKKRRNRYKTRGKDSDDGFKAEFLPIQVLVVLIFHPVLKYQMQNRDPFGIKAMISLWITGG